MYQPPMGDKDLASDVLFMEKTIAELFHRSSLEALQPQVRQTLEQINAEIRGNTKHIFDYMNRKGWYQPRTADSQTLTWFQDAVRRTQQEVGSTMANLPTPGQVPAGQQPWAYTQQYAQQGQGAGWYGQPEYRY